MKFEYLIINVNTAEKQVIDVLQEQGELGFELVQILTMNTIYQLVFKRQKEEEED